MDYCDPIDGVVVVDSDYLKGRKVFGQVITTYRYGKEEDEVMGVKFSKEMVLARDQIVPLVNQKMEMTPLQERLVKKLGQNAFPFTFQFPQTSPSSVTLQAGEEDEGKPLGVEYTIKCYVGENEEDKGHKRSQVSLTIKKVLMGLKVCVKLWILKLCVLCENSFNMHQLPEDVVFRAHWSAKDLHSRKERSIWRSPLTEKSTIMVKRLQPRLSSQTIHAKL